MRLVVLALRISAADAFQVVPCDLAQVARADDPDEDVGLPDTRIFVDLGHDTPRLTNLFRLNTLPHPLEVVAVLRQLLAQNFLTTVPVELELDPSAVER